MRMRSEVRSSIAVAGGNVEMGEGAGGVVEVEADRAFVCVVRRRKARSELASKMSSV
jgi:hypothetical protein